MDRERGPNSEGGQGLGAKGWRGERRGAVQAERTKSQRARTAKRLRCVYLGTFQRGGGTPGRAGQT
jgi:hypothetical protein